MTDETIGLQLYEALKDQGGLSLVTSLLTYAQIQELKAADREGLVRLFRGSGYEMIQRLKREPADKLAARMVREMESRQHHGTLVLFGIALLMSR